MDADWQRPNSVPHPPPATTNAVRHANSIALSGSVGDEAACASPSCVPPCSRELPLPVWPSVAAAHRAPAEPPLLMQGTEARARRSIRPAASHATPATRSGSVASATSRGTATGRRCRRYAPRWVIRPSTSVRRSATRPMPAKPEPPSRAAEPTRPASARAVSAAATPRPASSSHPRRDSWRRAAPEPALAVDSVPAPCPTTTSSASRASASAASFWASTASSGCSASAGWPPSTWPPTATTSSSRSRCSTRRSRCARTSARGSSARGTSPTR